MSGVVIDVGVDQKSQQNIKTLKQIAARPVEVKVQVNNKQSIKSLANKPVEVKVKPKVDQRDLEQTENRIISFFKKNSAISAISIGVATEFVKQAVKASWGIAQVSKEIKDNTTLLKNQLSLIEANSIKLDSLFNRLYKKSKEARSSINETAKLYSAFEFNMGNRFSKKDYEDLTSIILKSGSLSGASKMGMEGALLQFRQALSMGVLRGQEFNAVLQNMSYLTNYLAKNLNVTKRQLKNMADEGQLTMNLVLPAILRMKNQVNKDFQNVSITIAESASLLKDSIQNLYRTLMSFFSIKAKEPLFYRMAKAIDKYSERLSAYSEKSRNLKAIGAKRDHLEPLSMKDFIKALGINEAFNNFKLGIKKSIPKVKEFITSIGVSLVSIVGGFFLSIKEVLPGFVKNFRNITFSSYSGTIKFLKKLGSSLDVEFLKNLKLISFSSFNAKLVKFVLKVNIFSKKLFSYFGEISKITSEIIKETKNKIPKLKLNSFKFFNKKDTSLEPILKDLGSSIVTRIANFRQYIKSFSYKEASGRTQGTKAPYFLRVIYQSLSTSYGNITNGFSNRVLQFLNSVEKGTDKSFKLIKTWYSDDAFQRKYLSQAKDALGSLGKITKEFLFTGKSDTFKKQSNILLSFHNTFTRYFDSLENGELSKFFPKFTSSLTKRKTGLLSTLAGFTGIIKFLEVFNDRDFTKTLMQSYNTKAFIGKVIAANKKGQVIFEGNVDKYVRDKNGKFKIDERTGLFIEKEPPLLKAYKDAKVSFEKIRKHYIQAAKQLIDGLIDNLKGVFNDLLSSLGVNFKFSRSIDTDKAKRSTQVAFKGVNNQIKRSWNKWASGWSKKTGVLEASFDDVLDLPDNNLYLFKRNQSKINLNERISYLSGYLKEKSKIFSSESKLNLKSPSDNISFITNLRNQATEKWYSYLASGAIRLSKITESSKSYIESVSKSANTYLIKNYGNLYENIGETFDENLSRLQPRINVGIQIRTLQDNIEESLEQIGINYDFRLLESSLKNIKFDFGNFKPNFNLDSTVASLKEVKTYVDTGVDKLKVASKNTFKKVSDKASSINFSFVSKAFADDDMNLIKNWNKYRESSIAHIKGLSDIRFSFIEDLENLKKRIEKGEFGALFTAIYSILNSLGNLSLDRAADTLKEITPSIKKVFKNFGLKLKSSFAINTEYMVKGLSKEFPSLKILVENFSPENVFKFIANHIEIAAKTFKDIQAAFSRGLDKLNKLRVNPSVFGRMGLSYDVFKDIVNSGIDIYQDNLGRNFWETVETFYKSIIAFNTVSSNLFTKVFGQAEKIISTRIVILGGIITSTLLTFFKSTQAGIIGLFGTLFLVINKLKKPKTAFSIEGTKWAKKIYNFTLDFNAAMGAAMKYSIGSINNLSKVSKIGKNGTIEDTTYYITKEQRTAFAKTSAIFLGSAVFKNFGNELNYLSKSLTAKFRKMMGVGTFDLRLPTLNFKTSNKSVNKFIDTLNSFIDKLNLHLSNLDLKISYIFDKFAIGPFRPFGQALDALVRSIDAFTKEAEGNSMGEITEKFLKLIIGNIGSFFGGVFILLRNFFKFNILGMLAGITVLSRVKADQNFKELDQSLEKNLSRTAETFLQGALDLFSTFAGDFVSTFSEVFNNISRNIFKGLINAGIPLVSPALRNINRHVNIQSELVGDEKTTKVYEFFNRPERDTGTALIGGALITAISSIAPLISKMKDSIGTIPTLLAGLLGASAGYGFINKEVDPGYIAQLIAVPLSVVLLKGFLPGIKGFFSSAWNKNLVDVNSKFGNLFFATTTLIGSFGALNSLLKGLSNTITTIGISFNSFIKDMFNSSNFFGKGFLEPLMTKSRMGDILSMGGQTLRLLAPMLALFGFKKLLLNPTSKFLPGKMLGKGGPTLNPFDPTVGKNAPLNKTVYKNLGFEDISDKKGSKSNLTYLNALLRNQSTTGEYLRNALAVTIPTERMIDTKNRNAFGLLARNVSNRSEFILGAQQMIGAELYGKHFEKEREAGKKLTGTDFRKDYDAFIKANEKRINREARLRASDVYDQQYRGSLVSSSALISSKYLLNQLLGSVKMGPNLLAAGVDTGASMLGAMSGRSAGSLTRQSLFTMGLPLLSRLTGRAMDSGEKDDNGKLLSFWGRKWISKYEMIFGDVAESIATAANVFYITKDLLQMTELRKALDHGITNINNFVNNLDKARAAVTRWSDSVNRWFTGAFANISGAISKIFSKDTWSTILNAPGKAIVDLIKNRLEPAIDNFLLNSRRKRIDAAYQIGAKESRTSNIRDVLGQKANAAQRQMVDLMTSRALTANMWSGMLKNRAPSYMNRPMSSAEFRSLYGNPLNINDTMSLMSLGMRLNGGERGLSANELDSIMQNTFRSKFIEAVANRIGSPQEWQVLRKQLLKANRENYNGVISNRALSSLGLSSILSKGDLSKLTTADKRLLSGRGRAPIYLEDIDDFINFRAFSRNGTKYNGPAKFKDLAELGGKAFNTQQLNQFKALGSINLTATDLQRILFPKGLLTPNYNEKWTQYTDLQKLLTAAGPIYAQRFGDLAASTQTKAVQMPANAKANDLLPILSAITTPGARRRLRLSRISTAIRSGFLNLAMEGAALKGAVAENQGRPRDAAIHDTAMNNISNLIDKNNRRKWRKEDSVFQGNVGNIVTGFFAKFQNLLSAGFTNLGLRLVGIIAKSIGVVLKGISAVLSVANLIPAIAGTVTAIIGVYKSLTEWNKRVQASKDKAKRDEFAQQVHDASVVTNNLMLTDLFDWSTANFEPLTRLLGFGEDAAEVAKSWHKLMTLSSEQNIDLTKAISTTGNAIVNLDEMRKIVTAQLSENPVENEEKETKGFLPRLGEALSGPTEELMRRFDKDRVEIPPVEFQLYPENPYENIQFDTDGNILNLDADKALKEMGIDPSKLKSGSENLGEAGATLKEAAQNFAESSKDSAKELTYMAHGFFGNVPLEPIASKELAGDIGGFHVNGIQIEDIAPLNTGNLVSPEFQDNSPELTSAINDLNKQIKERKIIKGLSEGPSVADKLRGFLGKKEDISLGSDILKNQETLFENIKLFGATPRENLQPLKLELSSVDRRLLEATSKDLLRVALYAPEKYSEVISSRIIRAAKDQIDDSALVFGDEISDILSQEHINLRRNLRGERSTEVQYSGIVPFKTFNDAKIYTEMGGTRARLEGSVDAPKAFASLVSVGKLLEGSFGNTWLKAVANDKFPIQTGSYFRENNTLKGQLADYTSYSGQYEVKVNRNKYNSDLFNFFANLFSVDYKPVVKAVEKQQQVMKETTKPLPVEIPVKKQQEAIKIPPLETPVKKQQEEIKERVESTASKSYIDGWALFSAASDIVGMMISDLFSVAGDFITDNFKAGWDKLGDVFSSQEAFDKEWAIETEDIRAAWRGFKAAISYPFKKYIKDFSEQDYDDIGDEDISNSALKDIRQDFDFSWDKFTSAAMYYTGKILYHTIDIGIATLRDGYNITEGIINKVDDTIGFSKAYTEQENKWQKLISDSRNWGEQAAYEVVPGSGQWAFKDFKALRLEKGKEKELTPNEQRFQAAKNYLTEKARESLIWTLDKTIKGADFAQVGLNVEKDIIDAVIGITQGDYRASGAIISNLMEDKRIKPLLENPAIQKLISEGGKGITAIKDSDYFKAAMSKGEDALTAILTSEPGKAAKDMYQENKDKILVAGRNALMTSREYAKKQFGLTNADVDSALEYALIAARTSGDIAAFIAKTNININKAQIYLIQKALIHAKKVLEAERIDGVKLAFGNVIEDESEQILALVAAREGFIDVIRVLSEPLLDDWKPQASIKPTIKEQYEKVLNDTEGKQYRDALSISPSYLKGRGLKYRESDFTEGLSLRDTAIVAARLRAEMQAPNITRYKEFLKERRAFELDNTPLKTVETAESQGFKTPQQISEDFANLSEKEKQERLAILKRKPDIKPFSNPYTVYVPSIGWVTEGMAKDINSKLGTNFRKEEKFTKKYGDTVRERFEAALLNPPQYASFGLSSKMQETYTRFLEERKEFEKQLKEERKGIDREIKEGRHWYSFGSKFAETAESEEFPFVVARQKDLIKQRNTQIANNYTVYIESMGWVTEEVANMVNELLGTDFKKEIRGNAEIFSKKEESYKLGKALIQAANDLSEEIFGNWLPKIEDNYITVRRAYIENLTKNLPETPGDFSVRMPMPSRVAMPMPNRPTLMPERPSRVVVPMPERPMQVSMPMPQRPSRVVVPMPERPEVPQPLKDIPLLQSNMPSAKQYKLENITIPGVNLSEVTNASNILPPVGPFPKLEDTKRKIETAVVPSSKVIDEAANSTKNLTKNLMDYSSAAEATIAFTSDYKTSTEDIKNWQKQIEDFTKTIPAGKAKGEGFVPRLGVINSKAGGLPDASFRDMARNSQLTKIFKDIRGIKELFTITDRKNDISYDFERLSNGDIRITARELLLPQAEVKTAILSGASVKGAFLPTPEKIKTKEGQVVEKFTPEQQAQVIKTAKEAVENKEEAPYVISKENLMKQMLQPSKQPIDYLTFGQDTRSFAEKYGVELEGSKDLNSRLEILSDSLKLNADATIENGKSLSEITTSAKKPIKEEKSTSVLLGNDPIVSKVIRQMELSEISAKSSLAVIKDNEERRKASAEAATNGLSAKDWENIAKLISAFNSEHTKRLAAIANLSDSQILAEYLPSGIDYKMPEILEFFEKNPGIMNEQQKKQLEQIKAQENQLRANYIEHVRSTGQSLEYLERALKSTQDAAFEMLTREGLLKELTKNLVSFYNSSTKSTSVRTYTKDQKAIREQYYQERKDIQGNAIKNAMDYPGAFNNTIYQDMIKAIDSFFNEPKIMQNIEGQIVDDIGRYSLIFSDLSKSLLDAAKGEKGFIRPDELQAIMPALTGLKEQLIFIRDFAKSEDQRTMGYNEGIKIWASGISSLNKANVDKSQAVYQQNLKVQQGIFSTFSRQFEVSIKTSGENIRITTNSIAKSLEKLSNAMSYFLGTTKDIVTDFFIKVLQNRGKTAANAMEAVGKENPLDRIKETTGFSIFMGDIEKYNKRDNTRFSDDTTLKGVRATIDKLDPLLNDSKVPKHVRERYQAQSQYILGLAIDRERIKDNMKKIKVADLESEQKRKDAMNDLKIKEEELMKQATELDTDVILWLTDRRGEFVREYFDLSLDNFKYFVENMDYISYLQKIIAEGDRFAQEAAKKELDTVLNNPIIQHGLGVNISKFPMVDKKLLGNMLPFFDASKLDENTGRSFITNAIGLSSMEKIYEKTPSIENAQKLLKYKQQQSSLMSRFTNTNNVNYNQLGWDKQLYINNNLEDIKSLVSAFKDKVIAENEYNEALLSNDAEKIKEAAERFQKAVNNFEVQNISFKDKLGFLNEFGVKNISIDLLKDNNLMNLTKEAIIGKNITNNANDIGQYALGKSKYDRAFYQISKFFINNFNKSGEFALSWFEKLNLSAEQFMKASRKTFNDINKFSSDLFDINQAMESATAEQRQTLMRGSSALKLQALRSTQKDNDYSMNMQAVAEMLGLSQDKNLFRFVGVYKEQAKNIKFLTDAIQAGFSFSEEDTKKLIKQQEALKKLGEKINEANRVIEDLINSSYDPWSSIKPKDELDFELNLTRKDLNALEKIQPGILNFYTLSKKITEAEQSERGREVWNSKEGQEFYSKFEAGNFATLEFVKGYKDLLLKASEGKLTHIDNVPEYTPRMVDAFEKMIKSVPKDMQVMIRASQMSNINYKDLGMMNSNQRAYMLELLESRQEMIRQGYDAGNMFQRIALSKVDEEIEEFGNSFANLIKEIKDAGTSFSNAIKNNLTNVLQELADPFSKQKPKFKDVLQGLSREVTNHVVNGFMDTFWRGPIDKFFKNIGENFRKGPEWLRGLIGSFFGVKDEKEDFTQENAYKQLVMWLTGQKAAQVEIKDLSKLVGATEGKLARAVEEARVVARNVFISKEFENEYNAEGTQNIPNLGRQVNKNGLYHVKDFLTKGGDLNEQSVRYDNPLNLKAPGMGKGEHLKFGSLNEATVEYVKWWKRREKENKTLGQGIGRWVVGDKFDPNNPDHKRRWLNATRNITSAVQKAIGDKNFRFDWNEKVDTSKIDLMSLLLSGMTVNEEQGRLIPPEVWKDMILGSMGYEYDGPHGQWSKTHRENGIIIGDKKEENYVKLGGADNTNPNAVEPQITNRFIYATNDLLSQLNKNVSTLGEAVAKPFRESQFWHNVGKELAAAINDYRVDHPEAEVGMATGGWVNRGSLLPGADDVSTKLSRGEYVVRAAQAAKFGGLLEAINADAFAPGGKVNKKKEPIWQDFLESPKYPAWQKRHTSPVDFYKQWYYKDRNSYLLDKNTPEDSDIRNYGKLYHALDFWDPEGYNKDHSYPGPTVLTDNPINFKWINQGKGEHASFPHLNAATDYYLGWFYRRKYEDNFNLKRAINRVLIGNVPIEKHDKEQKDRFERYLKNVRWIYRDITGKEIDLDQELKPEDSKWMSVILATLSRAEQRAKVPPEIWEEMLNYSQNNMPVDFNFNNWKKGGLVPHFDLGGIPYMINNSNTLGYNPDKNKEKIRRLINLIQSIEDEEDASKYFLKYASKKKKTMPKIKGQANLRDFSSANNLYHYLNSLSPNDRPMIPSEIISVLQNKRHLLRGMKLFSKDVKQKDFWYGMQKPTDEEIAQYLEYAREWLTPEKIQEIMKAEPAKRPNYTLEEILEKAPSAIFSLIEESFDEFEGNLGHINGGIESFFNATLDRLGFYWQYPDRIPEVFKRALGGLTLSFASGGSIPSKNGRVPSKGGKITGQGGPKDDRVLAKIPEKSFIVNAKSSKKYKKSLDNMLAKSKNSFNNSKGVLAYVSPGEYYMPPSVTSGNVGALSAINAGTAAVGATAVTAAMGGFIPAFEEGGSVLRKYPEAILARGKYSKDIEKVLEAIKGKLYFIAKNVDGKVRFSVEKEIGAQITEQEKKMADQLAAYFNKESKYPTQQAKTMDILKKTSGSVLNIAQSVVMFKNGSFFGGLSSAITAAIPAIQAAMPEKFGDDTKNGILLKAGMGVMSGAAGIASLFSKQGKKMGSGDKATVLVSSVMNMLTGLGNAKDAWDILKKKEQEEALKAANKPQSSSELARQSQKGPQQVLGAVSSAFEENGDKTEESKKDNNAKSKGMQALAAAGIANNPEALSKVAMEIYNILIAINMAVQQIKDKVAGRSPQSSTASSNNNDFSTSVSDFNLEGSEGTDLIGTANEQAANQVEKLGQASEEGAGFFSGLWDKAKGFFDNFMGGFSNIWSSVSSIFSGLFGNKGEGNTESGNMISTLMNKGLNLAGNLFGGSSEEGSDSLSLLDEAGSATDKFSLLNSGSSGGLDTSSFKLEGVDQLTNALGSNADAVGKNTEGLSGMGKMFGGLFGRGGSNGGPSAGGGTSFGGIMGMFGMGYSFGSTLGGFLFSAEGGPVSGPGTSTSDSIPAMLSNGEFVMSAEATKNNAAVLTAINNGADFRDIFEAAAINAHFAEGGFVGPATIDSTAPSVTASTSELKPNPIAENGAGNSHQEFSIAVTGDVSAQTSREIRRMIPEIAAGVRQHGRVKGWTW